MQMLDIKAPFGELSCCFVASIMSAPSSKAKNHSLIADAQYQSQSQSSFTMASFTHFKKINLIKPTFVTISNVKLWLRKKMPPTSSGVNHCGGHNLKKIGCPTQVSHRVWVPGITNIVIARNMHFGTKAISIHWEQSFVPYCHQYTIFFYAGCIQTNSGSWISFKMKDWKVWECKPMTDLGKLMPCTDEDGS